MVHIRESRPEYGTYKTVKARLWHISESQGQIMVHIRQSRPEYGTYKAVKARLWHI